MTRVWIPDTKRKPIPASGQIVGWIAERLRVKGVLKDALGADPRTARRWFAGEHVEVAKRDAILRQLVEALESEWMTDGSRVALPKGWLLVYVSMLLAQWDATAASLRTASFPITEATDVPLPFLRLVALDAGLRIAAAKVLRQAPGRDDDLEMEWLVQSSFKVAMDSLIARCGKRPTLEAIQVEAKVSKTSLDSWRAADQIPHDENLRQLAACLSSRGAGPEPAALAALRFGAAVSGAWRELAKTLSSPRWLDDLADGLRRVVRHAVGYFRWLPLPVDRDLALADVVVNGAHCAAGAAACEHLANLASLCQEVQYDFLALPGDWPMRINEHVKDLETIPRFVALMPDLKGKPAEEIAARIATVKAFRFRLSHWDSRPEDFPHAVVLSPPPEVQAMNRLSQATRSWSAGQHDEAIAHLRRAVELDRKNASLHYELGCYLGIRAHGEGLNLVEEALLELRLAIELGEGDANMQRFALTEIGIVQSNAGLLDEALANLEQAEPAASDWAHYWGVRASVLMWLARYNEANAAFQRALDLNSENPEWLARRAAVLWKLGRVKHARDLARRVELLGFGNPEPAFEAILNSAPRRK